ncbi:MAG: NAD(P)/FAD-dependent oxidoreductase, partial [Gemmatimonadales bacterium]
KAGIVGDVLFTHRGLSGPAVLDLSGTVAQLLDRGRPVPVRNELVAGMDAKAWARDLESWRSASGGRQVVKLLQQLVPASLCRQVCALAGLDPQVTAAQLSAARQRELAATLSGVELTVTATEGFDAAFVTRGGVKLKEVDPATLRSRVLDGLYVVGELLDLDGPTGGYNLQWAFASGWLAGLRCRGRGDTP